VGLALVTGVLVFAAVANFSSDDSSSAADSGDVKVLVAKDTINAGAKLNADMFRVATFSENNAIAAPVDNADAIVGQTITTDLQKGQQLSRANIASATDDKRADQLAFKLPDGYRGVGVKVDKVSTFGGLVVPGDRVDVVVTYEEKDSNDQNAQKYKRVSTVLQNVLVVAREQVELERVNTLPTTPAAGEPADDSDPTIDARPKDVDTEDTVNVVTLALSPGDIQQLVLADALGDVTLSLRKFGEESTAPLEDVRVPIFD
jgi:pilus assembly protein CpaB